MSFMALAGTPLSFSSEIFLGSMPSRLWAYSRRLRQVILPMRLVRISAISEAISTQTPASPM